MPKSRTARVPSRRVRVIINKGQPFPPMRPHAKAAIRYASTGIEPQSES
jgi:hypothetical protein